MIEDNTFVLEGPPPLKPLPDISLGKLLYDQLLSNPSDDDALVDSVTQESITYRQILSKTSSLAEALKISGYGRNTIISLCSENCVEFFIPVLAALYNGAILAPINHNYTKSEMIHTLNITKPTIVFCSEQVLPKFVDLQKSLNFMNKLILISSKNTNNEIDTIDSFIFKNRIQSPLYRFSCAEVSSAEQTAFIMCSSGTTGLPKGVMLTHKNIITRIMQLDDPRFTNQQAGRVAFGVLPFFHSYGMFTSISNIYQQVKIIVLKKFDEHQFLSAIEKYKISYLQLVPPLAIFLAKSPLVDKYDISSITEVSCGAAPLGRVTEETLKNRFKIKSVKQAYGLTESTLGVMRLPIGNEKFGSSGKMLSYMKGKIRDPETGKSLGPYKIGELCFKGPMIMKGYYGNIEATQNAFSKDGWLLTGDLGYYDDEGYFYVVDRLKELIKYKGFQVAPAELEALLLTNPKIKDAAVVGVPDEEVGELPMAFVVPNPGVNVTEEELKNFVAEKVSSQKRLRGGVVFVGEIPKNPSGKILRRTLRTLMKKYHKSKL